MKKMILYLITLVMILSLGTACLVFCENQDSSNIEFLEGYGWKVEPIAYEKEKVLIPNEFDDVYKNYNELQQKIGFDLSAYKGKECYRYTYVVTNCPIKTDNVVFANVLCCNSKQIAGDVMTTAIDGFMIPLNYLQTIEQRLTLSE